MVEDVSKLMLEVAKLFHRSIEAVKTDGHLFFLLKWQKVGDNRRLVRRAE